MRKERNMAPDAKIGIGEHIAYGLGNTATETINNVIAAYLLVYYTMVVGVNTLTASGILAFSRLLDGFSDLIMGYVVDHTHTKMGKAKPWFLRFIIPTVLCFVLTFNVPHSLGGFGQLAYIFITYNLISTVCLTALGVSYTALNGLMTTNQSSRGLNGVMARMLSMVGTLIVSNTILKMTAFFGNGDVYAQRGWTVATLIFAGIYVVLALINHFFTFERVADIESKSEEKSKEIISVTGEKVSTIKVLVSLFKNKFWVLALLVCFILMLFMGVTGSTTVYFTQYILGDVDAQATLISFLTLGMLPGILLSVPLMPKLGKRNVMIIGLVVNFVGSIMPVISLNIGFLNIASAIKGLGYGIAAGPMGSIVQDTITYGTWKNGFNSVGMGNAANSFANKVGTSLGTLLTGFLLGASGFVEQSLVQSETTLNMIKAIYIWIPALTAVLCTILLLFYTLDKFYPEIERDLKEGKYAPEIESKRVLKGDAE